MDAVSLIWFAADATIGLSVGLLAFYWKRRSMMMWIIYGALTFGLALPVLAFLPRLERRSLSDRQPRGEHNWHRQAK